MEIPLEVGMLRSNFHGLLKRYNILRGESNQST